jgi:hypothetical protein
VRSTRPTVSIGIGYENVQMWAIREGGRIRAEAVRLMPRERIVPTADIPRCMHRARGTLLAEFVARQSGLRWRDVAALECPDVHLFAQLFMSSNYLARTDRDLLGLDDRMDRDALPFTRGSLWLAWMLGGLTLFTLVGFCGLLAGLIG